jgi:hypothetical protein
LKKERPIKIITLKMDGIESELSELKVGRKGLGFRPVTGFGISGAEMRFPCQNSLSPPS